jgi:hypothetical protein
VPLNPLARTSLGLGGIVLFTGGVAAIAHADWFAGVFLVVLGMVCVLATFVGIDARRSASPDQAPPVVPSPQGMHTPPTVPWQDRDRRA